MRKLCTIASDHAGQVHGQIVCPRFFHIPLLLHFPIFSSFLHTRSGSQSSIVLQPRSPFRPPSAFSSVHVRNQYRSGVTHTSSGTLSRRMKRRRSGARHAIAPQATPAWQVIHLPDLITENKGHIRVILHLLASLLEGSPLKL